MTHTVTHLPFGYIMLRTRWEGNPRAIPRHFGMMLRPLCVFWRIGYVFTSIYRPVQS